MNDNTTTARKGFRAKVASAVAAAAAAPGLALASGGSGFDASEITAQITANAATAVGIVGAFALAVWGLRAMGLLKRG